MGELEPQVSHLKKCLYCQNPLPSKSKEHLFNACWGGHHKTKNLICDECNQYFSKTIDDIFHDFTIRIMNAWNFKGDRHKKVPIVPINEDYFFEGFGKLKRKYPKTELTIQPDGNLRISILCNSKGEARRELLDRNKIEEYLGCAATEESKRHIREILANAKTESKSVSETQTMTSSLDLVKQYRSVGHTILKCLGYYHPFLVEHDLTFPLRQFVRYGEGNWFDFAIKSQSLFSLLEYRRSPSIKVNTVEIYWDSHLQKIIGTLTILGKIKRSIVIAEKYSGDNQFLLVAEDALDTKKRIASYFIQFLPNVPPSAWVNVQKFSLSTETIEYFMKESADLLTTDYYLDIILSQLTHNLTKFYDNNLEIDRQNITELQDIIVKTFLNIDKIRKEPLKPTKLHTKLLEFGFSHLAEHHLGEHWKQKKVDLLVINAIKQLLKYLKTES